MRGSHYPQTGMHLWSQSLGQWANDLSLFRSHLFENLVPEVTDFNIFLHYVSKDATSEKLIFHFE